MREIKFRAWDKTSKKMCEVWELRLEADIGKALGIGATIVFYEHLGKHTDLEQMSVFRRFGSECELMQFTGLKDRNGKEIYDRDTVRTNSGNVGVVSYSDSVGWHIEYKLENNPNINKQYPYDKETKIQGLWKLCFDKWCEVIGNIYENPELGG